MAGALPQWPDMDYKLSGWLAGQAASEREAMLREAQGLQNLYQQAQTRGQDLTNQGMEAKLPYLGDEARLKNVQTQQGIDLKLPEQGLAKTLANDPTYMQGQSNLARGKQQGQLGQQEIQNRITHYDMLMDAYATNGQMGVIDTARKLQVPFEQLQGHFQKGGDPLKSMQARRQALATQMSLTSEQVGKERIEGIKGQNDIDVANIKASSDKTVAGIRAKETDKQVQSLRVKELNLYRQTLANKRSSLDALENKLTDKEGELSFTISRLKNSKDTEEKARGIELEKQRDSKVKEIENARRELTAQEKQLDAEIQKGLGLSRTAAQQPPTAPPASLKNNTNVEIQKAAQAAWGSYEPDVYTYGINPKTKKFARAKKQ